MAILLGRETFGPVSFSIMPTEVPTSCPGENLSVEDDGAEEEAESAAMKWGETEEPFGDATEWIEMDAPVYVLTEIIEEALAPETIAVQEIAVAQPLARLPGFPPGDCENGKIGSANCSVS